MERRARTCGASWPVGRGDGLPRGLAGTTARAANHRAHAFGTGLYGFATKPLRVFAHAGNDPLRAARARRAVTGYECA